MSELQKIAADMRDHAVITGKHGNEVLQRIIESWADALDALAAQGPVAKFVQSPYGNYPELKWRAGYSARIGDCVYAAPQPSPPQSAVSEEFEKALDDMICLEQQSCDAAHTGKPYGHLRVAFHEARAEVLRLYALASAAPLRPTVSREALCKALNDNHSPDVSFADIAEAALRALGIEVK